MAKYYPDESRPGAPSSELKVRSAFAHLDDRWRVLHAVTWQSKRWGREGDGEADFLLLHPEVGFVVLEVKGGRVDAKDGKWFTIDRHDERHVIKNPFEQAKDSKYALLKFVGDVEPRLHDAPACHGVVFPDVTVPTGIGPYGPREIILDAEDLLDSEAALRRLTAHWGCRASLTTSDCNVLIQHLAPTVHATKRLRTLIAEVKEELLRLTNQQIRVLDQLGRNRRAAIYGPPGSGKTILAVERAKRLALSGFRVLVTCYNGPLSDHLAEQFADNPRVEAMTYHSLCVRECGKAGFPIPYAPPSEWWQVDAPNLLLDAVSAGGPLFDAIVVDEGQDFIAPWLSSLLFLLTDPDDGPLYLFADSQQAVYERNWALPGEWSEFDLDLNCRSTLEIARRVAGVFHEEARVLGASGPEPVFVTGNRNQWIELALDVTERLLTEGELGPQQVVVLAVDRDIVDDVRARALGDWTLVELGKHGVVCETVQRFKGLEADVVVLILGDMALLETKEQAIAYVGLSRARTMLFVVGTKSTKKALGWT